jgi:hypothetical protein
MIGTRVGLPRGGMEGNHSWKDFMRKHGGAVFAFAVACVALAAWGVYVFWWFVGNAQSTGLVPAGLGLWTMGDLISFILYSILWELLLVGVPAVVGAAVAWRWWSRLPVEERMNLRMGKKGRTRASGGVSLYFFLVFALKVYLDGNWNVPIASFSLNYVVGSMITILVYTALILGVPAAIASIWWIRRQMARS